MPPLTRTPPPPPPPAWWLIALLVLALLGLGVMLHQKAFLLESDGSHALLPGLKGVEVAVLPDHLSRGVDSPEALLLLEEAFLPLPPSQESAGVNPSPGREQWYRFTFAPEPTPRRMILDLIWSVYDRALLYHQNDEGNWEALLTGHPNRGDLPPSPLRKAYELEIPAAKPVTFFLFVRDYYRLPTQFRLWQDADIFFQKEAASRERKIAYLGFWTALTAYSLFLFAMLRERSQFHYVCFLLLAGLLTLWNSPAAFRFAPDPYWPLIETVSALTSTGMLVCLCLFVRTFLETADEAPRLDWWLSLLQRGTWASLAFLPLAYWPPTSLLYLQGFLIMAAGVLTALLAAGVRCWRSGSRLAPFLVLALAPLALGLLLSGLRARTLVIEHDTERVIYSISHSLSLIFLSFATAFRHRRTIEEKIALQQIHAEKLEEKVDERTNRLAEVNKALTAAVTERDRVMAIIGHDLRGPAVALTSLTRIVSENESALSRDQLQTLAREIGQACDLQLELLNNLLIWGGLKTGEWKPLPVPLDVREVAHSVTEIFQSLSSAKRLFLTNGIPREITVRTDTQLLETILRNLVSNAIKFTPPGGHIRLSAQVLGDGSLEVGVQDTGIGMESERLQQLFEGGLRSTRGTKGEKGTGIGLTLCRDLAHSIGGDLRIESLPGNGTSVFLLLPATLLQTAPESFATTNPAAAKPNVPVTKEAAP